MRNPLAAVDKTKSSLVVNWTILEVVKAVANIQNKYTNKERERATEGLQDHSQQAKMVVTGRVSSFLSDHHLQRFPYDGPLFQSLFEQTQPAFKEMLFVGWKYQVYYTVLSLRHNTHSPSFLAVILSVMHLIPVQL